MEDRSWKIEVGSGGKDATRTGFNFQSLTSNFQFLFSNIFMTEIQFVPDIISHFPVLKRQA